MAAAAAALRAGTGTARSSPRSPSRSEGLTSERRPDQKSDDQRPHQRQIIERRHCRRRARCNAFVQNHCPIALVKPVPNSSTASNGVGQRQPKTAKSCERTPTRSIARSPACSPIPCASCRAPHRDAAVHDGIDQREQRAERQRIGARIGDDKHADEADQQRSPSRRSRPAPAATRSTPRRQTAARRS